jgi:hypothetical protein
MIKGKLRGSEELLEHDNKIHTVLQDVSIREEKIVIIDADSLLYIVSWPGKDPETLENKPPYTEEEYPIAEGYLTEHILKILSNIEEYFDVAQCYICVKGKKNFRYQLFEDYKVKRPPTPNIVNHLAQYVVREHNAIQAHGYEADDLVYSISEDIEHDGIICGIDKDLHQIPSIFYNYQKDEWKKVNVEDARYNFAVQMITGDCGDGINFTPKHGIKYAEKVLRKGMSDFAYLRQIVIVFKKCWGAGWKAQLTLAYKLLKLHKIETLENNPIKEEAA